MAAGAICMGLATVHEPGGELAAAGGGWGVLRPGGEAAHEWNELAAAAGGGSQRPEGHVLRVFVVRWPELGARARGKLGEQPLHHPPGEAVEVPGGGEGLPALGDEEVRRAVAAVVLRVRKRAEAVDPAIAVKFDDVVRPLAGEQIAVGVQLVEDALQPVEVAPAVEAGGEEAHPLHLRGDGGGGVVHGVDDGGGVERAQAGGAEAEHGLIRRVAEGDVEHG